jgi:hypothetical protein
VGFDAGVVLKELDWDFTRYGGGKGVVPEPSDKAMETLFKDLAKVSKDLLDKAGIANLTEDADPGTIMQVLSNMEDSIGLAEMINGYTKAFAKLCQNQPSAIQLNKLPMRGRMLFYKWLMDELRPEVGGAVSMPRLNGIPAIGTRA